MGGFTVVRKVPTSWLCNSGIAGLPQWTGPSNLLTFGAPVAHPIFPNIYSVPFSMSFSLDMLAQYTELVGIADKYKINSATVKVLYSANSIMGGPSTGNGFAATVPSICWCPDSDDNSVSSINQLQAKMGLRSRSLGNGKYVSLRVRPKVAPQVYNGLVTSAYSVPGKQMFINGSSPSVPHYGIKGYFENWDLIDQNTVTSAFTFDVTLNVSLRDLQ